MMINHILCTVFALATAGASGVAAWFWFASSKVNPEEVEETEASINDYPEMHIMEAKVGVILTHNAMNESSRLNKIAAAWSGVAAVLGAITAIMSAF